MFLCFQTFSKLVEIVDLQANNNASGFEVVDRLFPLSMLLSINIMLLNICQYLIFIYSYLPRVTPKPKCQTEMYKVIVKDKNTTKS